MTIISGRKFLRIEMISTDENNPGLKILPNKDAPSPIKSKCLKIWQQRFGSCFRTTLTEQFQSDITMISDMSRFNERPADLKASGEGPAFLEGGIPWKRSF